MEFGLRTYKYLEDIFKKMAKLKPNREENEKQGVQEYIMTESSIRESFEEIFQA